ncbi:hypothetical protein FDB66_00645 [Clostridium botulinum]|nr:hypothetical protein [Clostridium botulinum]
MKNCVEYLSITRKLEKFKMKWLEYVILVINILLTLYTMYNAFKANKYYIKSKCLTDYANNNLIFIETKKILENMTTILIIQKNYIKNPSKGKNYDNELSDQAKMIDSSIKKIKEIASPDEWSVIERILKTNKFEVELYIDSILSGKIRLKESENIANEDYKLCKECFQNIQQVIKCKIDEKARKLN